MLKDKKDWTQEDFSIYEAGKRDILLAILKYASTPKTLQQMIQCTEESASFLRRLPRGWTLEGNENPWQAPFSWTSLELLNYLKLLINDCRARLGKARETYAVQQILISELKQLSFGGLTHEDNI